MAEKILPYISLKFSTFSLKKESVKLYWIGPNLLIFQLRFQFFWVEWLQFLDFAFVWLFLSQRDFASLAEWSVKSLESQGLGFKSRLEWKQHLSGFNLVLTCLLLKRKIFGWVKMNQVSLIEQATVPTAMPRLKRHEENTGSNVLSVQMLQQFWLLWAEAQSPWCHAYYGWMVCETSLTFCLNKEIKVQIAVSFHDMEWRCLNIFISFIFNHLLPQSPPTW